VIVVTKNEARRIAECLGHLTAFDDIWVVDSGSRDATADIAKSHGAQIVNFTWDGQYPKKRQWCLDTISTRYPWIFFVDADEIVTPELVDEIGSVIKLNPSEAGFFITGRYRMGGKILRFGISNQKIVLIHKNRMEFPVVDDLDIPGMGEIEGHYQPVLKQDYAHLKIGKLKSMMIHDTMDDERAWIFRHEKYARWEAGMNAKNNYKGAWPIDPVPWRQWVKLRLRQSRFRPELMFLASFILKMGMLDGRNGLDFARKRAFYYRIIKKLAK
jgi:glycosyltransferase involved in cell wall biosynthesis